MSEELKIIKQLPATKEEIGLFAERINQALDDGSINPLELLKYFKAIEKLNEAVKPMLDRMALKEAEKYPEKTIEVFDVKFLKKNGPAQWDYTNCNDAQYVLLAQYKAEYDKKLKERQEFLQHLPEPMEFVDDDSGETYKIYPAAKSQKELVQVNFQ